MLLRFNPIRDLDRLTREILDDGRVPQPMPMDCYRDSDAFVLQFDLPGIDTETLEVTEENGTLTVRAQRHNAAPEDARYLMAERPTGAYARQLFVGAGLDLESITAGYHDGVLTLTIPVSEQVKPRRIDVGRSQDSSAALAATGRRGIGGPADTEAPPAGAATS